MARKKKKISRKQLKQQRQAAIQRKREARGWKASTPDLSAQADRNEIISDMQPLLPKLNSENGMEELAAILLDSWDLVKEPEFEAFIIEPTQATSTLIAVAEESEKGPSSLDIGLDEAEQLKFVEIALRRLLTPEVRQQISSGLNTARLRLRKTNKPLETAKIAAIQSFLGEGADVDVWVTMGLARAIFQRSLEAGFVLMEASTELRESMGVVQADSPLTIRQKLNQSTLGQKAESMFNKVPGLNKLLRKQADQLWDAGVEALYNGELFLEIFREDEVRPAFDLYRSIFSSADDESLISPDTPSAVMTKESVATFVTGIEDYLDEILTLERLETLRERLTSILDDSTHLTDWSAFLLMLLEYVSKPDIIETDKTFFVQLYMGEFRAVTNAISETEAQG